MEQPGKKSSTQSLKEKLEEFKIIPQILRQSPNESILILFQSGAKVNKGNLISFYQCSKLPNLFYWKVDNFQTLFTIVIIDIDYSKTVDDKNQSYLIFLASNIQGNDIMKGDILADYEPVQPAKENGKHRILILGYQQTSYIKIMDKSKINDRESRINFSIDDFIQNHSLASEPNFGNFYLCSN